MLNATTYCVLHSRDLLLTSVRALDWASTCAVLLHDPTLVHTPPSPGPSGPLPLPHATMNTTYRHVSSLTIAGYIKRAAERTIEFNVNQRDTLQRTALHWAAELGHIKAAELLIDYGCDIRAVECNGRWECVWVAGARTWSWSWSGSLAPYHSLPLNAQPKA